MSATAFAASDDMLVACTEGRRFAGRPIAQWTKSPGQDLEVQFIVTDHLGTPVGLLDSTEAVVWRGFLDPFGPEDRHGPSSFGLSLRLPGQLDDPFWHRLSETENGFAADLYYNVHRWYEPGTGRYVSSDPFGLGGASRRPLNELFAYAHANPIANSDRLGLWTVAPGCRNKAYMSAISQAVREVKQRVIQPHSPCALCETAQQAVANTVENAMYYCPGDGEQELAFHNMAPGDCGSRYDWTGAGVTDPPSIAIHFKDPIPGVAPATPFCNCLAGTIYHEATHIALGANDGGKENNAYDHEKNCRFCDQ